MTPIVTVRPATPDDVVAIHAMIVALAVYEREPDAVKGTPAMLHDAVFGAEAAAEAVIAEIEDEIAGFALFYPTFSTWEMTSGIWLEDLFVHEQHRRAGVGDALIRHLAQLTITRGFTRLEWAALTWNTPALSFYAKLGAERLDEWAMHRLDGATLTAVASGGG